MAQEVHGVSSRLSTAATSVSIILAAISFAFLAVNRVGLRYTPILIPDPGNPNPIVLTPSYAVSTGLGLSPLSVAAIGGVVALVGLIVAARVLTKPLPDKKLASFAIGLCLAAIVAGFLFAI
jgi:hypothetical protein